MSYRVAYDVLDDVALPSHTAALLFLGGAVFFTLLWVVLTYCIRKTSPGGGPNAWPEAAVGGVLIGVGVLLVATGTYRVYLDQNWCKARARAGDYETVEGTVTHFRRENGKYPPTHFEVGDVRFTYQTYEPKTGGFRGEFTAPGTEGLKLQDGLRVRIAHRDGRILRLEVAE